MFHNFKSIHRDERGQAALETAIILIAFIVVASVFAFTILSAGTASTDRGEEAIYEGLEGVQSTMAVRGAVIAEDRTATGNVTHVTFSVTLASGGSPIELDPATGSVVVGYRDSEQYEPELTYTVAFIGNNDGDTILENDELAELTVAVDSLTTALAANTEFTIEVKPPAGAVLNMSRTTPPSIEKVMELR